VYDLLQHCYNFLGVVMITQVRKIGNSLGHIIPMALVQQFGLVEGTKLNIQECNGAMMIEPIITKKFPFSEQELLNDLNSYAAHADELAPISSVEWEQ